MGSFTGHRLEPRGEGKAFRSYAAALDRCRLLDLLAQRANAGDLSPRTSGSAGWMVRITCHVHVSSHQCLIQLLPSFDPHANILDILTPRVRVADLHPQAGGA